MVMLFCRALTKNGFTINSLSSIAAAGCCVVFSLEKLIFFKFPPLILLFSCAEREEGKGKEGKTLALKPKTTRKITDASTRTTAEKEPPIPKFDKLETASYWLGQIKLAESVGKHFVSVAFFRLAFDSNAEAEWKEVSRSYGILKDESNGGGESLELGKGKTTCR
ncbi:hypothetical protein POTOM_053046 [Populus tomentosa]|uniref:Uncharacterized protein n=1 Tax=Populus tomentosa TaxID=118781 RepID=A0A8X7Y7J3_POPTO|nr:hypothetical protein POTOM_053046 [Populus tomentosa]